MFAHKVVRNRRNQMDQTKASSKAASAIRVAARSAFRSAVMSSLALRKQLWIWPIIAAILLGACGWWVSQSVENAMRQRRDQRTYHHFGCRRGGAADLDVGANRRRSIDRRRRTVIAASRGTVECDARRIRFGADTNSLQGTIDTAGTTAIKPSNVSILRILPGIARWHRDCRRSRCTGGQKVDGLPQRIFRRRVRGEGRRIETVPQPAVVDG